MKYLLNLIYILLLFGSVAFYPIVAKGSNEEVICWIAWAVGMIGIGMKKE